MGRVAFAHKPQNGLLLIMWNWLTYLLTLMTVLTLVVSGGICCPSALAMELSAQGVVSDEKAGDASTGCGCAQGEPDADGVPGCCGDCEAIGENSRPVDVEPVEVALTSQSPLDGFKLPPLQPRFQALLAVWFADFLEPVAARESAPIARFIDPGPPSIDVPIYLQVQNLRL